MLRTLTVAGLSVVLLPCEPCSLPLIEHVIDEIGPQSGIHGCGTSFVSRGRSSRNVLYIGASQMGCVKEIALTDFINFDLGQNRTKEKV